MDAGTQRELEKIVLKMPKANLLKKMIQHIYPRAKNIFIPDMKKITNEIENFYKFEKWKPENAEALTIEMEKFLKNNINKLSNDSKVKRKYFVLDNKGKAVRLKSGEEVAKADRASLFIEEMATNKRIITYYRKNSEEKYIPLKATEKWTGFLREAIKAQEQTQDKAESKKEIPEYKKKKPLVDATKIKLNTNNEKTILPDPKIIMRKGKKVFGRETYLYINSREEQNIARNGYDGARFDYETKLMYAPEGSDYERLKNWLPNEAQKKEIEAKMVEVTKNHKKHPLDYNPNSDTFEIKTYLAVPNEEEERANALEAGTLWDTKNNLMYAEKGVKKEKFAQWIPEQRKVLVEIENAKRKHISGAQGSGEDPMFLLSQKMNEKNLDISVSEIELDGRIHRVDIKDGNRNNKRGWYIGDVVGGISATFSFYGERDETRESFFEHKGKEYIDNRIEKELELIWKARKAQVTEQDNTLRNFTADLLKEEYDNAKTADPSHPYLKRKQIKKEYRDIKEDSSGRLIIPFYDIKGKLWSVQKIWDDGKERKGKMIGRSATVREKVQGLYYTAKKEECLNVIGGDLKDIENLNPLIIAEGFATTASINEALDMPIIMGIDSGNMKKVAKSLRDKYPAKTIVIAGDNDKLREMENKKNVGKETALWIEKKIRSITLLPDFTTEETNNKNTDWNDWGIIHGKEKMKDIFEKTINSALKKNNQKTIKLKK